MSELNVPLALNLSSGQLDEVPVHVSAVSHLSSFAARHTVAAGAKLHCSVQHALLSGSHTAPFVNLHVDESQHDEVTPEPGSQSSPSSTIPLPHICSEMVSLASEALMRHVVLTPPSPPRTEPKTRKLSAPWCRIEECPTDVAQTTLRERVFRGLRYRTHDEFGIGITRGRGKRATVVAQAAAVSTLKKRISFEREQNQLKIVHHAKIDNISTRPSQSQINLR